MRERERERERERDGGGDVYLVLYGAGMDSIPSQSGSQDFPGNWLFRSNSVIA